ncbi:uncharacterized protein LOC115212419 [Argonauta hians]
MRHLLVIFWCCIFHMLCATTGGRYIDDDYQFKPFDDSDYPDETVYNDRKVLPRLALDRASQFLRAHRATGSSMSDEQFVEVMFSFFDVNRNQMISKTEFRDALELLGVVSWNF